MLPPDALLFCQVHNRHLFDTDGKSYIDAAGGALVVSIGHGVQEIAESITRQTAQVAFAHGSQFITDATLQLAGRIAQMTPGDLNRVYFVSGGSEATEAAIKLARQYHVERGESKKYKIISRWFSYHGATLGAVSISGLKSRRDIYEPMLLDFPHIPPAYCYRCPFHMILPDCRLKCADQLEETIEKEGAENVAAFIAEPMVGAALGAVPAPEGYFARVREICDRYNVLFIADEVMSGVGRTGKNFGIDHHGQVPDMIAMAKGLSSGYAPIGALAVRDNIYNAIRDGSGEFVHGHTFGQHPVSCAAGLAVIDYIQSHGLIQRAEEMGQVFMEKLARLNSLESVGDIRGEGLMLGVEFVRDKNSRKPYPQEFKFSRKLFEAAFAKGLIVYPGAGSAGEEGGDHILLGPHFITTEEQAEEIVIMLEECIQKVEQEFQTT